MVEVEHLPHSVVSDRGFYVHVFQNLLSNAIRYEGGKGIVVGCRYEPGEGADGLLVGSVADKGACPVIVDPALFRCPHSHALPGCGMDAETSTPMFDLYAAGPPRGTGLGP